MELKYPGVFLALVTAGLGRADDVTGIPFLPNASHLPLGSAPGVGGWPAAAPARRCFQLKAHRRKRTPIFSITRTQDPKRRLVGSHWHDWGPVSRMDDHPSEWPAGTEGLVR